MTENSSKGHFKCHASITLDLFNSDRNKISISVEKKQIFNRCDHILDKTEDN